MDIIAERHQTSPLSRRARAKVLSTVAPTSERENGHASGRDGAWMWVGHLGALALLVVAVLTVYHGWLQAGIISAGDWVPTPDAHMLDDWPVPQLWSAAQGSGGGSVLSLVVFPQRTLYGLLAHLGFTYSWVERVVWIFPAILGVSIGGYIFSYSLFRSRIAALISGLFLVCNSYIVLVDGGGQFTVGGAYAIIPFVLWSFRSALRTNQGFRYVLTALLLAIQGGYDLRFTYVTVAMLALYVPFIAADLSASTSLARMAGRLIKQAVIWVPIELSVNLPWLLPSRFVVGVQSAVAPPAGYNTLVELHGLSFMLITNALSLMHPFWPLNPFAHPAPLDPVMFAVPLLLFAVLLKARLSRDVLYLYALTVVGMFFVKGSNPPVGQVYEWLFLHLPGFSWFRDPSKFYQPLMLGAGTLLGYAVVTAGGWLKQCVPPFLSRRAVVAWPAAIAWSTAWASVAIYPALPGVFTLRSGTLQPWTIPAAYTRLNTMIESQPEPFSVLWYSGFPHTATYSERHPIIAASVLGSGYPTLRLPNGDQSSWLSLPTALDTLRALSVKYVVVPSDPFHSLYSATGLTQQAALAQARRYLKGFHETTIGDLHVFASPSYLPLIYIPSRVLARRTVFPSIDAPAVPYISVARAHTSPLFGATIDTMTTLAAMYHPNLHQYTYAATPATLPAIRVQPQDATRIDVHVHGATRPFMLLFLQTYDPNWQAYVVPTGVSPSWLTLWRSHPLPERNHVRGIGYANAWWVDARGSFTLVLLFRPQLYAAIGGTLCWLTIIGCALYVIISWRRRPRRRTKVPVPKAILAVRRPVPVSGRATDDVASLIGATQAWHIPNHK